MGLIGSALGAVGSIFGGISASKAMKRMKGNIEGQRASNQAWYDRKYNEDATQRADAQRIITKTEESIRNRNRSAAGSAAVMGGTEESVAATKAANNQALAEVTSQIAAGAESRKDQIEQTYQAKEDGYLNQLNQLEANKAKAVSEAVQGVAGVASTMPF